MASGFRQNYTFTIPSGQSKSGTVDLGGAPEFSGGAGAAGVYLFTPSGWDAAALGIEISQDGVTWANFVGAAGTEAAALSAVTANTCAAPNSGIGFTAARFIRFHSGTLAAPVNQTADRTFTLVLSRAAA